LVFWCLTSIGEDYVTRWKIFNIKKHAQISLPIGYSSGRQAVDREPTKVRITQSVEHCLSKTVNRRLTAASTDA